MVSFTVYGKPAPQGSHRAFMPKGARFPVVTDDNPQTRPWKQLVKLVAQEHRPPALLEGPIALAVDFYLQRPKSLPKRHVYPTKKPDLDKCLRSILDALTGVVWVDDALVVSVRTSKMYGTPRAEISVEEVGSAHSQRA